MSAKKTRFNELKELFDTLHGPQGCMWDKKQTHKSILEHLREESEEFIAAVRKGDTANMQEEIGDVLLHVMFHAKLAEKAGKFDIEDVIGGLIAKLKRRHPHVFGCEKVSSTAEIISNWEKIKKAEKAGNRRARARARK